ncbi:uncharacterized protein G2W53_015962 [Senna tora]|uniref:Uncharacterized protein n=1 Tax=Senna tora TaxID=362788 RepID=A0A834WWI5_9FABA|nr:uncharacterized protein G2W53_015962 [Senna tora]
MCWSEGGACWKGGLETTTGSMGENSCVWKMPKSTNGELFFSGLGFIPLALIESGDWRRYVQSMAIQGSLQLWEVDSCGLENNQISWLK